MFSLGLKTALAAFSIAALAAAQDPCIKITGKTFIPPADARACLKSFPFNETLRQNVLTNVARVTDFFTFEEYYEPSPPPFQESTVDIRATLDKLSKKKYTSDYDFNMDLFHFTTQLNDGHTRWFPSCYTSFQNIAPAPVANLLVNGIQGTGYTGYFDSIGFDWKRLAGAKVLLIEGLAPYTYVDKIAKTISGNYLDHGIRVNSVFTSYRISANTFSQRVGDLAGPTGVEQDTITFLLVPVGKTLPEVVKVPFLASFAGAAFTDGPSYWANNCLADETTNGVDLKELSPKREPLRMKAEIIDKSETNAINLPQEFFPTLPIGPGSAGVIKSYILPGNVTGVLFVGSFGGSFFGFQSDVVAALANFKAAGVTKILIDLTGNGGGFVCLGQFLFQYLSGSNFGYPGFISTARGNPLAQKIVAADIAFGLDATLTFYTADNYAFLNGTAMDKSYNYMNPVLPFRVNGRLDPTSQRYQDTCTTSFAEEVPATPPFDLKNIAIVSNGNCASTCAMFSTLMAEHHDTKIAVFGGKPGERMEYKGMAGNQVLEWADFDTEIKTAGVKNDALAPPDLLVKGNYRHNWRTAWSWLDTNVPIAYKSDLPQFRFSYTNATYNNPQNLWTFAASKLLA